MPKRGKKYQEALKLFDRHELYEPEKALEIVKSTATAKFDETIEVAVKLGVDPRHADQHVWEPWYCLMVPVKPEPFWFSPRERKLKKLRQQVLTLWEQRNLWKKFKADGSALM